MIYCLVGRPGTGKTYSLVKIAYDAVLSGRNVYTNFHIDFTELLRKRRKRFLAIKKLIPFRFLDNWFLKKLNFGRVEIWKELSDFTFLREGLILMDEAQIYINSREYKSLPPSVQYKFQQHRKHGLDLYLAVQNVKRIDIVARELVNSVFEFRRVGKLFVMSEYDIEEIDKAKRESYGFKFFFFDKVIASCYDTMQEVRRTL